MMKLCGVVVGLVLLVSGCSAQGGSVEPGPGSSSVVTPSATSSVAVTPKGDPKTLKAATAAATEIADRFSSGDFGGVWQMMSASVRKTISEADYVKLSETCSISGLPMTATGVRMEGTDKAVVRLEVAGFKQSRTMVYEDGHWYQAPSPDFAKRMSMPVDKIIAAEKSEGGCSK